MTKKSNSETEKEKTDYFEQIQKLKQLKEVIDDEIYLYALDLLIHRLEFNKVVTDKVPDINKNFVNNSYTKSHNFYNPYTETSV